MHAGLS